MKVLSLLLASVCWGQITDANVHPQGDAPTLPSRDGTYTDPVFGTTVWRLTDATDGTACHITYNSWAIWSPTNQFIAVNCTVGGYNKSYIYEISQSTHTATTRWEVPLYSGDTCLPDQMWMSGLRNVAYCVMGTKLAELDLETKSWTLIKDISLLVPEWWPAFYLMRISVSRDEDRFTAKAQIQDSTYALWNFIVYEKSTDSIIRTAGIEEGEWRDQWDVETAYVEDDLVTSTNQGVYRAVTGSEGVDPATDDGTYWVQSGGDYKISITRDGLYLVRARNPIYQTINVATGDVATWPGGVDQLPGHGDVIDSGYIGNSNYEHGSRWTFPGFTLTNLFFKDKWNDIIA
jgi:hypothetical protein